MKNGTVSSIYAHGSAFWGCHWILALNPGWSLEDGAIESRCHVGDSCLECWGWEAADDS